MALEELEARGQAHPGCVLFRLVGTTKGSMARWKRPGGEWSATNYRTLVLIAEMLAPRVRTRHGLIDRIAGPTSEAPEDLFRQTKLRLRNRLADLLNISPGEILGDDHPDTGLPRLASGIRVFGAAELGVLLAPHMQFLLRFA